MERIALVKSDNPHGEAARGFEARLERGFWDKFVRPGAVVDIGYKGANPDALPIFRDAIGIDLTTPGYNGRDLPFGDGHIGTIHASHLLEHIADYQHFFRECMRVLRPGGTLILMVPLMEAYEGKRTPPSLHNEDHKRFYTAGRLCAEFESILPRHSYRIAHLQELFSMTDLARPDGTHADGPLYEIECVVEKTVPGAIYV
jgi:SAM-dependent methyltransferase